MSLDSPTAVDLTVGPSITTTLPSIDRFFGGQGIPTRQITEICGAPGSGRTQLTAQVMAQVNLPRALGGLSGETIYVDTRGALSSTQCADVISSQFNRLRALATGRTEMADAAQTYLSENTPRDILENRIHHYRVTSFASLLATITGLPLLLHKHPMTRLLVINGFPMATSETGEFTGDDGPELPALSEEFKYTSALCNATRCIASTAMTHELAVILCTNLQRRGSVFVPPDALWTRPVHNRVFLQKTGENMHTMTQIDPVVVESARGDKMSAGFFELLFEAKQCRPFVLTHRGIEEVDDV
ncbi:DNA repair protein RAD51 [Perkinsela sp. CCAP 1560/4]|nr:DNA repair protein RAD51 [Perkinsela sp. CCAP 1560/4]|eukprot:KNH05447.1 DNA repair protein RAD51 [Perkinsela sp. CCAP 1560/4]